MNSFWDTLEKPYSILAPMADVTDHVFRTLVTRYSRHGHEGGGPDVFWTEFVAINGLMSPGRMQLLRELEYHEGERPVVAQIFGTDPEKFLQTAQLIRELGFDGVDINTGCPDRNVNKQGAGAALIKDPGLMADIVAATKEGAQDMPVTVKTRIGWAHDETDTWIQALVDMRPRVVIIHARTRNEMSKVPPHYDAINRAVEIADGTGVDIVVNGDILTTDMGIALCNQTGADGYMIGKGVFGTPWLFDTKAVHAPTTIRERLMIMLQHTRAYVKGLNDCGPGTDKTEYQFGSITVPITEPVPAKSFNIMKKHYKAYVNGWHGAKDLRTQLMDAPDITTIESVVEDYLATHPFVDEPYQPDILGI